MTSANPRYISYIGSIMKAMEGQRLTMSLLQVVSRMVL